MKKIFIAVSFLAASFAVNAQEYRPVAGDITAEAGLTGGILNSNVTLNSGSTLKFRYFLQDKLAARLGVNIASNSLKENVSNGSATNPQYGTIKGSYSSLIFNLGVEKHFSGTDRLATYAGADLLLSFTGAKETGTDVNAGGAYAQGSSYKVTGATSNSSIAAPATVGTGVGLRVVFGAEYYFVEKAFIGTELGWGFLASSVKDVKFENNPAGGPNTTTTAKGNSTFNLNPAVVAAIRIGWRF